MEDVNPAIASAHFLGVQLGQLVNLGAKEAVDRLDQMVFFMNIFINNYITLGKPGIDGLQGKPGPAGEPGPKGECGACGIPG